MREEEIDPILSGPISRGVFPLSQALFSDQFGQESFNPRWASHGVFGFARTADRSSLLSVTSGYLNP